MTVGIPGVAVSVFGVAVLSPLQGGTTQGPARSERRSNERFIIFLMVGY